MLKHWPLERTARFRIGGAPGSFHQAAEELHLTQSAISQQIRSLEAFWNSRCSSAPAAA